MIVGNKYRCYIGKFYNDYIELIDRYKKWKNRNTCEIDISFYEEHISLNIIDFTKCYILNGNINDIKQNSFEKHNIYGTWNDIFTNYNHIFNDMMTKLNIYTLYYKHIIQIDNINEKEYQNILEGVIICTSSVYKPYGYSLKILTGMIDNKYYYIKVILIPFHISFSRVYLPWMKRHRIITFNNTNGSLLHI